MFRAFLSRCRLVLLPALLLLFSCVSRDTPIRIGLMGPLHNNDGSPMHNAALMAIDEINRAGGINGRPLELVERDDYGNPDSALFAAQALEQAGVVAVIGSVYSSITLRVAPIFNNAKHPVVQISPSSSSPAITTAGPYTFRVCPSDLAHGGALARFARQQLHVSRAAVLYQNDAYGRGMRRVFVEEFTRLGGTVVENDPYIQQAGVPAAYIERLAVRDRPELIFLGGMAREGGMAIRQSRTQGLGSRFMGGDGLSDLAETDPVAEGAYISVAYLEEIPTEKNRRFVEEYHRRFPDSPRLNKSGAGTYEAIYLLKDAIARVGTNRRAVRDAVAGVGTITPAFEGLIGPIAFDENGDVPTLSVVVGVVQNGALKPAQVDAASR